MVVSVVTLKAVGSRRPYLRLKGENGTVDYIAPDNNDVADGMMLQTISTRLLCVLLKAHRESGGGVLGEKALDVLMVASQFLFVLLLVWKRVKRKEAGSLVAVLPVLEEGESDSAKIARLEREKVAAENGREAAENGRLEAEKREKEAREEIERLKKDS